MKETAFKLLLIHLILFPILSFSQHEEKYKEYYQKATIATFYSSSFLNGYYELELAFAFADSAKAELSKIPKDNLSLERYQQELNSLEYELNISKSISVDNLNYIYPHYSLIAGYRSDFNLVDDAEELLVEEIVLKQLEQADPLYKGNLIDNTHYILFTIQPYDPAILGVCLDFIGTMSKHYAIRPHEISSILSENGVERYKANSLTKNDWEKILDYYSANKLYNFSIEDKGSIINNLYYKGINLNIVEQSELTPTFVKYFESFRLEKSNSFNNSLIMFLFSFLAFFMLLVVGFEDSVNKIKSRLTLENVKADFIIVFFVVVSIFLSNYLLSLLDPGINAFKGDPLSIIWIILNVFLPIVISFILSFLFTTKFSSSVTTDLRFRSKFIFAAISAPILSDIFYMNHAKFFFDFNLDFIAVPFILLLASPSRTMGKLWYKIANKGEIPKLLVLCIVLLLINYYFAIIYFAEHHAYFYFTLIAWVPLSIFGYMASKSKTNLELEIKDGDLNSLINPKQYIRNGTNIDKVEQSVNDFISSESEIVYILKGKTNIGKTRFIEEFKKSNSINNEIFYGDFDEFKEGIIQLYEPFYQAFCQHDNEHYKLDKGFFSDRSVTFNSLKSIATIASKAGPIDLGEIISIDDNEGLSVNEISGELIEFLLDALQKEKLNKKIVLVLDDYQWVDSATNELLISFYNKIKNRGKFSAYFKIILTISDYDNNRSNAELNFSTCYDNLINDVGETKISMGELLSNEPKDFLEVVLKDSGYQYFDNNKINFSPNLKVHLQELINDNYAKFNPGNFFNYLQALKNSELLGIEGNLFRLIKLPDDDFRFDESEQILMKSKFESLTNEYQKTIESAAHIGYKFDASIVAHIWKKDLIEVINILEEIEVFGLIEDDPNLDNVFSFTNKNFHRWLRAKYSKETKSEYTQRVIEFQKRIIDSILSKGEIYIKSLDIDILKSISNRCNMFENIEEIEINALKFNLVTAEKLTNLNKLNQAIEYLIKAHKSFKQIDHNQILQLKNVIGKFQEIDNSLQKLEIPVPNGSSDQELVLLDEIFDTLLKKTDSDLRSKTILIFLLEAVRTNRDIQEIKKKPENEMTSFESARLIRFNKLYDIVDFIVEEDKLRADFYLTLMDDRDSVTLSNHRKSAIANGEYQLASEISRTLAINFKSKDTIDKMHRYVIDSLLIEGGMYDRLKYSEKETPAFDQVLSIIKNLLSNTNISYLKAKNLSYCISRLIEVYFIKEKYENVIDLGIIGESLNKRIGDNRGLYIIWYHCGTSFLYLENIKEAETNFKLHFETLIKTGSDKKYFISPLEGILYCCKRRNDFTLFNDLKEVMYEHLLYIDNDMKESVLITSNINKDIKLADLIPVMETTEEQQKINQDSFDLSNDIFKLLYCISKADGEVAISEVHDISESVNAVSFSLGHRIQISSESIAKLKDEIDELQLDSYSNYFREICIDISSKHNKNMLKSIYHFCLDIAKADGRIDESEQELIEIAKKYFYLQLQ